MDLHKLSSTDAFVAFDLGSDVPGDGVARVARKILVDGAVLLARSTTYAWASFGIRRGGASAGVNAEGDARDGAVAAFVEEVSSLVAAGRLRTDPDLGLNEEDLAPLRDHDTRPPELWRDGLGHELAARGAVAAAGALGGLDDARCAVFGDHRRADAARALLAELDVTIVDGDGPGADCDVLFLAGRSGVLDHEAAATVRAHVVVPLTPVPVTARAHAVLSAADRIHVPDFLSVAAPLLHAHAASGEEPAIDDPVGAVRSRVADLADEGTGLWMAAALAAEEFLRSWREDLPFGRPLA